MPKALRSISAFIQSVISAGLHASLMPLLQVKVVESKCLNNEVTLEELDKNLRQTTKMASDNEQKLDELSR